MRQLGFGILDLKLHTSYNPETDGSISDYARNIARDFNPSDNLPDYYSPVILHVWEVMLVIIHICGLAYLKPKLTPDLKMKASLIKP
ncbi:MAG: hypothetical protein R3A13_00540 [Bdellovibrionota bacterium]